MQKGEIIWLVNRKRNKAMINHIKHGKEGWYNGRQFNSHDILYKYQTLKRKKMYDTILKSIDNPKSRKFLDIGCGDGYWIKYFSEKYPFDYYGMDYNFIRIRRFIKNNPQQTGIIGDATERANFKKNTFDIIFSAHCLEHVHNTERFLESANYWLKKEGVFILSTPQEGALFWQLRNRILQPKILKKTDHVHFFTKNKLKIELEKQGFEIKSILLSNYAIPYTPIDTVLSKTEITFELKYKLMKTLFPSQAGEITFICKK